MSVALFKCDWFKLDGKRTALQDDGFFRSINVGSMWYKDDCFILATHARKVFYLPDTRLGENWQVVQIFDHMHLYNVSQLRLHNIMLLHLKRTSAMMRSVYDKQFLTLHMISL
jgi:hypothetical protein